MKFPDAPRRSGFFATAYLLSVIAAFLFGRTLAFQEKRAEWQTLIELPVLEFYALQDPPMVIQKAGPRTLGYRPLPSRHDVHVVQLFANQPPPIEPSSTTTTTTSSTTVPKKKQEKK